MAALYRTRCSRGDVGDRPTSSVPICHRASDGDTDRHHVKIACAIPLRIFIAQWWALPTRRGPMRNRFKSLQDHLAEIPWVRSLPDAVRVRVSSDAYEQEYEDGAVVAHNGEPSSTWIGVLDGFLKVTTTSFGGRTTAFNGIPAGSWVGEGSVLKREIRRYDISAMRRSRVVHVPAATFRWLLDTNLEFNHFIMAQLNERLGQYIGMVEIDRLTDPVAKIARSIGSLFNPILYPSIQSVVPLSQAELGEVAGLSRQTANKCIKQLEREGLVSVEYGAIYVRDVMALKGYPAFEG